jgi:hypothetical protein
VTEETPRRDAQKDKEVKQLRMRVESLEGHLFLAVAVIVIGILLVIFNPGYRVFSNGDYADHIREIQKEERESIFEDDGLMYNLMICTAYFQYMEDKSTAAMTRWLEADYDIDSLENWCLAESPPPEPDFFP